MTQYSRDRWLYPIEIVEGANQLRITDISDSFTATITPGVYWAYESIGTITGYPKLLTTISDNIGVVNQDIFFRPGTPSLSNLQTNGGYEMYSGEGDSWSLDFDHVDFTLPPELLGFPADQSTQVVADSNGVINPPFTPKGVWDSPVVARRKIGFQSRKIARATEDVERSDAYELDWGSRLIREVVYQYVPAAHVHGSRALLSDYAQVGELAIGDTFQGFDAVWESLAKLDTILVLHGGAGVIDAQNSEWEAVRLMSREQAESFANVARLQNLGGEYYELALELVRIGGVYEQ